MIVDALPAVVYRVRAYGARRHFSERPAYMEAARRSWRAQYPDDTCRDDPPVHLSDEAIEHYHATVRRLARWYYRADHGYWPRWRLRGPR